MPHEIHALGCACPRCAPPHPAHRRIRRVPVALGLILSIPLWAAIAALILSH
jgi:hypothetical protein